MSIFVLGLLIVACFAHDIAITKAYTEYLKAHVSWEVQDYENNIFRGWTGDEISRLFGDKEMDLTGAQVSNVQADITNLPKTLDWSGVNCCHYIRNQGNCGSCWAFAVSGVISDRCCLAGTDHGWLAPQELVSCDNYNSGCDGGDRTQAMRYVAYNGLVHDACFPYVAKDQTCLKKCADGYNWNESHVCKCNTIWICNGEANIMTCLAAGPVAAGFAVYNDFMYYKSGIYRWDRMSEFRGYHAVRLIGYGVGYWKCANSWGASWGEDGCFRIGKGECNIETRNPVICDVTP